MSSVPATRTIVVKFGGSAIDESSLVKFASDVFELKSNGLRIVVVHGGGPQIDQRLKSLGIASEFIRGFRKTTPEVLDVAKAVLLQIQNRIIVSLIARDVEAVGLVGDDDKVLQATRRIHLVDGHQFVDGDLHAEIGLVGDIQNVHTRVIERLLDANCVPVVTGFGFDASGSSLNVNADIAAGAIAGALQADQLVMMTDVAGLYQNWPNTSDFIDLIHVEKLQKMLPDLDGGIAPKVEACIFAVSNGVRSALIVDGREPHSLVTAVARKKKIGTEVVAA